MPKSFLNKEIRKRLRKILDERYPDFIMLYPGKTSESLSDEELYDIVGEDKPIEVVLGQPSVRTDYQAVRANFPEYEIDFKSLRGGQLERLARETEHIDRILEENQYRIKPQEPKAVKLATPPRKPAIGNSYSACRGESRIQSFKASSPRRGINPRDERY